MLKKATQNQNQKKKRHTIRATTVRFCFPTSNHPSPSVSSCNTTDSNSVFALAALAVALVVVPVTDPIFTCFPGTAFVELGQENGRTSRSLSFPFPPRELDVPLDDPDPDPEGTFPLMFAFMLVLPLRSFDSFALSSSNSFKNSTAASTRGVRARFHHCIVSICSKHPIHSRTNT